MQTPIVRNFRLSQTFKAPLDFVYQWCTDFREDDNKMTGSKSKRTFFEKSKKRYIWLVNYEEKGKKKEGIRLVWLHPPDAWHLDTCGDGRELGEYKLKRLGNNKTRLDMTFQVTYDSNDEVETREEWEKDGREHWAIYAKYLEKDYAAAGK